MLTIEAPNAIFHLHLTAVFFIKSSLPALAVTRHRVVCELQFVWYATGQTWIMPKNFSICLLYPARINTMVPLYFPFQLEESQGLAALEIVLAPSADSFVHKDCTSAGIDDFLDVFFDTSNPRRSLGETQ